MACGRWIVRAGSKALVAVSLSCLTTVLLAQAAPQAATEACDKPVYLTIDTGHMGVATLVGEVLRRQQVRVTFFVANVRTRTGGSSMDETRAPWWRAMAEQGHTFASHTFDHVYWQGDTADGGFRVRASAGPDAGRPKVWTTQQYCDELARPAERFEQMTGQNMLPLFRAPGGRTSPALVRAAEQCGYRHVGWSAAGFLGDELPSDKYPNATLLADALRNIRPGDILMAHLGIWSRQEPWAPAVLEPLIEGLKRKGFCFATIDAHPAYRAFLLPVQLPAEP